MKYQILKIIFIQFFLFLFLFFWGHGHGCVLHFNKNKKLKSKLGPQKSVPKTCVEGKMGSINSPTQMAWDDSSTGSDDKWTTMCYSFLLRTWLRLTALSK